MSVVINGDTGISGVDGTASTPALQGNDTNTGITFGTDTVNIVTGGSTRATVDSSGNFQFASGYGSVATAYGCRAWVNFNGTGTVAIRGSGNVTSITDNGVGDYTVNFTSAMPDTNYVVSGGAGNATDTQLTIAAIRAGTVATGSTRISVSSIGGGGAALTDFSTVYFLIIR